MNRLPRRRLRRIFAGALLVGAPFLAAHPVAAAASSTADRTMPNLEFTCPGALGDHEFTHILPDGPLQEQCFYKDKDGSSYQDNHGSEFAVGASWATVPAEPDDPRAVCADPARTVWHVSSRNSKIMTRSSATHRANVYVALNLYWATEEKLARQQGVLDQAEALADEMLTVAERLAQPCFPATPTASPSPSDSPAPTGSPSESVEVSASPEPSATDDEPLCEAVDGQLTDNDGEPVEDLVVRLSVRGRDRPAEAVTDSRGRFRFDDLPDTEEARDPEAARLAVLVRDGGGTWRVHAGGDEASLVTDPFPITESDGCRRDLTTESLDGYESANPARVGRWAVLWTVVAQTRQSLDYLTTELDVDLRDLPVVVYLWCPSWLQSTMCTRTGHDAFAFDRTPTDADLAAGLGVTGRVPYIALASGLTDSLSRSPWGDTVYHELGHVLQADLAGGFARLVVAGRTPHGGYANASSNDSWIEGFASWFAVSVRQAEGRVEPYYAYASGIPQTLTHDLKAWDANGKDEEWAVAALLMDLTDDSTVIPGPGRRLEFTVTGSGPGRVIRGTAAGARPDRDRITVDYYDPAGTLLDTRRAHLSADGGFLSVPPARFATAQVLLHSPESAVRGPDGDGFAAAPRTLVRLLTDPPNIGTRGGRPDGASTVFDIQELYRVLRPKARRARDIDNLFIAHGFHENLENHNEYVRGAVLGMTTHKPFDRVFDPRYGTEVIPERMVTVDTDGADATVIVFPEGGVPYEVTPDASHRVPVMVPGGSDSGATVVTLVDGAQPAVTLIEGKTFWPAAAEHGGSFLTIAPALVPVEVAHAESTRPVALVVAVGGGLALLAFGAGGVLIGLSRRRRRVRTAT